MTAAAGEILLGHVTHRRFTPRAHFLRYTMFQLCLDIDRLPELGRGLRLLAHNRFGLFSFHERDHGDGRRTGLRAWADETLRAAGVDSTGGRITLLAMPRILGYVFNPLSVYLLHDRSGALSAAIYEVNNTFGERHFYVFKTSEVGGVVRHSCAKAFYVSPFMDMAMTYRFQLEKGARKLSLRVDGCGENGDLIIATRFTARPRILTDTALAAAFVTHPFLTLKVVAAIRLEAVKLLAKGLRIHRRPPAPTERVTFGA